MNTRIYGYIPKRDYLHLAEVIIVIGIIFIAVTMFKGSAINKEYTQNMESYRLSTDLHQFDVKYDDWSIIEYEGIYYLRGEDEEIYSAHSLDQVMEIAMLNK